MAPGSGSLSGRPERSQRSGQGSRKRKALNDKTPIKLTTPAQRKKAEKAVAAVNRTKATERAQTINRTKTMLRAAAQTNRYIADHIRNHGKDPRGDEEDDEVHMGWGHSVFDAYKNYPSQADTNRSDSGSQSGSLVPPALSVKRKAGDDFDNAEDFANAKRRTILPSVEQPDAPNGQQTSDYGQLETPRLTTRSPTLEDSEMEDTQGDLEFPTADSLANQLKDTGLGAGNDRDTSEESDLPNHPSQADAGTTRTTTRQPARKGRASIISRRKEQQMKVKAAGKQVKKPINKQKEARRPSARHLSAVRGISRYSPFW